MQQTNQVTAATHATTLTDLPPELLFEIFSHLPTSALVALKLSSKPLVLALPDPPPNWTRTASPCERKALRHILQEHKDLREGRRQCIHCRLIAPLRMFPIDAPLCKWHAACFRATSPPEHLELEVKVELAEQAARVTEPTWVKIERMYCAHSRQIFGWHVASCGCHCSSCGHFAVECFVNITPEV